MTSQFSFVYTKAMKTQPKEVVNEIMRSERIQRILTELACSSSAVSVDMLPLPFNEELILDFGDEAVEDLKSKKEILKFDRSWVEMVEEEEMRQENALKVEAELKLMSPQMELKYNVQEELKKVASRGVMNNRFLVMEKVRMMWQPIHQELMTALKKRNLEKKQIERRKEMMTEVYDELKIMATRFERRKEIMEKAQAMWMTIHKDLMATLTNRNLEKIQIQRQKEIKLEVLKELKIVASREFKRRKTKFEREQARWKAIHKDLIACWARRELNKKRKAQQKEFILEMLKELKVTVDIRTKLYTERQLEEKVKSGDVAKTCKQDMKTSDEDPELFIPRKLFLFNVETFKTLTQNVETGASNEVTEIGDNNCTPNVEMMPTVPKKKTFIARFRKFFGLNKRGWKPDSGTLKFMKKVVTYQLK